MTRKAVLLTLAILSFAFLSPGSIQGAPDVAAPAAAQEEAEARQLRIYREALLQGTSDDIRSDAAVGLLLRPDEASRQILVDALKAFDNPAAQRAVCQALITSRGLGRTIGSRQVYLDPLMTILRQGDKDQAVLASEALLIFDYSDIDNALNQIITQGADADQQRRINGIYALKIRPEPAALQCLIGLLGDSDPEVVQAAEDALQQAFGIPVGTSREVWADILKELQQKSPDDIRRERLLRQEMKVRQMQADRDRWQKLYLSLLDKQYEALDEAGRSAMILETLSSELGPVRVWALGKTVQLQAVTNEQINKKLFSLLADENREVRLQAAKVLNNMSALNPAEALLAQYKIEKDPEVALAIFDALGEACFYAFSPGSTITLSADIKTQTLDIAAQYLNQEGAERARKGADVIRKILELNNLNKESVQAYLELLYKRYELAAQRNPALQADLLDIMAHLCGQGAQKGQAALLYEASFIEGLKASENPALRLASARGLIAIDKVKALDLFKKNQLENDKSLAVRQVMIDLAGETGNADDLGWLLVVLNDNSNSEDALDSIKRICERQTAEFLMKWIDTLQAAGVRSEYIYEILVLAEKKAAGDNNIAVLKEAQSRSVLYYISRGDLEGAVGYLKEIGFTGNPDRFTPEATEGVFDIYLKVGMYEQASKLIANKLTKRDLSAATGWVVLLDEFFSDESISYDDKTALLGLLSAISVENRPQWLVFMNGIRQNFQPAPPGAGGVSEAPTTVGQQ